MSSRRLITTSFALAAFVGLACGSCPSSAALALTTGTTSIAATAASREDGCPATLRLESADGGDYLTVFESSKKVVASFAMRFFSYDTDYVVDLPNVTISTPYQGIDGIPMYRSSAIDVHVNDTPPDGATVVATLEPAKLACAPENVQIEPYGSIYHQKEMESRAGTDTSLDAEMESLKSSVFAMRAPVTKFPCETPFTRPIVKKLENPRFPNNIILNAEGTVYLSVSLDAGSNVTHVSILRSSGNPALDDAAKFAASNSTYQTEMFACKPVASHYIFRSTFSG